MSKLRLITWLLTTGMHEERLVTPAGTVMVLPGSSISHPSCLFPAERCGRGPVRADDVGKASPVSHRSVARGDRATALPGHTSKHVSQTRGVLSPTLDSLTLGLLALLVQGRALPLPTWFPERGTHTGADGLSSA